MKRGLRQTRVLLWCLLALAIVAVAGCSSLTGKKSSAQVAPEVQEKFDMHVQPFKKEQFVLDGAVLTAQDLSDHLSYLRDESELPGSILLEPGSEGKIRKGNIRLLGDVAAAYDIPAFYADGDQIIRIPSSKK